ncbi:MAG: DNA repair protein RecN [Tepidanaerobacteraceae bacterium]|jgi:DNA repair protein RecN (Recombination protein N)|nr:DNA repair protein RecN [Tepidanaerobacteraceae bacterium]
MLLKLHIKNFALIDDIEINFKTGLNILTGETGAGKSIIIDAISMLIGERASIEYIRTGKQSSTIEAVFDCNNDNIAKILKEYGIEKEDELLFIDREITCQGRNFCHINGKLVPTSVLKRVGKHLIDIHGQHQHQSLLDSQNHIKLLDLLGYEDISQAKKQVSEYYREYRHLIGMIQEMNKKRSEFIKQKDRLKFEVDEIEKASLQPNEDELLEEEKQILQNSEKIFHVLESSYNILYRGEDVPSIVDGINKIITGFEEIRSYYRAVDSFLDFLKNMLYEFEDLASNVRALRDSIEFDPQRLNELQLRLELIDRLKSKYNMTISELISYKEQAAARLEEVYNIDEEINNLHSKLKDITSKLIEKAMCLHMLRVQTAQKLEHDISEELKELGMKDVKFSVNFTKDPDDDGIEIDKTRVNITEEGFDRVEFMISTNPGEPLKPLSKIISGGETSRIMLALKNIMAKVDNIPCLIFDEIDTGIGGRAAQVVGEKLSMVARSHQVLCVTHSPQIASLGDNHFLIRKQTENGATFTQVLELSGSERVKELARMLGGAKITENTLTHAKEMLEMAKKTKSLKKPE